MDPNATLKRIENAAIDSDADTVKEACEDLQAWISNGGFAPQWARFPEGTRAFNRWQARRFG